jgi:phenylpropionate dioxygenase-like ring-hydroxylating dioxygenase large terminal subunit
MNSVSYQAVTKADVASIGTGPIPAKPYYDEGYFRLEQEAIFKRAWLHVGRASEVAKPGQFIVREVEVANASVLIVRGEGGELRAFHNVCAHRGAELVEARSGQASAFSCRYHRWTYGTDGAVRFIPDEAAFFDLDKAKCSLTPVAIDTCAGFIFINLDRNPRMSLREFLGEDWFTRLESLHVGGGDMFSEYVFDVDANWKVAYDNFQEIYHGKFVHAHSIGKSITSNENPFGYPTKYEFSENGLHRSKTLWNNPGYEPTPVESHAYSINREFSAKNPVAAAPTTDHYYLFPNVTFLAMRNRCFTQTIWPLGPHRTRSVIRQYWEGQDTNASLRFAREWQMASLLDVHSEDRDIIEASHKGLKSGAREFIHFQIHEVPLRHAFNAVDRWVQEFKQEQAGATAEAGR